MRGNAMRVLMVSGIFPPDRGGPASYVPRMELEHHQRGRLRDRLILIDRAAKPLSADGAFPCVIADDLVDRWTASKESGERGLPSETIYVDNVVTPAGARDREQRVCNAERTELTTADPMHAKEWIMPSPARRSLRQTTSTE